MRNPIGSFIASISTVAALLSGCARDPRQSDFTSAATANGGGAKDQATPAGGTANATPTRAVEEADIVKDDGAGHLYLVNAYRGLEIIDVRNPDAPKLIGRTPILGHPVDMYLANGLAYVIVSDYFTWWWDPQSGLGDFHGSQVKAIDVRNPAAPRELNSFRLDGFISDSRRVGDVIYAVSNVYSWLAAPGAQPGQDSTFVASIDVADPMNPHLVQRLDFPGMSNRILATADSLFVAQPQWTGNPPIGETHLQLVDISDPAGKMKTEGGAVVPGYLDSKFQMDQQGSTLRILTHDGGWGANGTQRISTFTVAKGQLAPLGHLDLPKSGGLFGVRFDGPRAYFATQVSRDPLEIVDLTNPARPTLLASLEVQGTLQQIVPRGDRLLALGSQDGTWHGVQMTLYDVSDGAHPSLLATAPVGGAGTEGWSQASWDDKALAVIDSLGLCAVPFSAWSQNHYTQGLQLVDFSRDTVRARGLIQQPGAILRALPVGKRLATLSELSFITTNIDNRDAPKVLGTVELVRNVLDFTRAAKAGVLLLGPRDWQTPSDTLRLRTVLLDTPDDGSFLGELTLPESAGWLLGGGDLLYVLGQAWDPVNGQSHVRLHTVDVSNPAHPKERGVVELSPAQNEWFYGVSYWGGGQNNGVLLVDGTLLVLLGQRGYLDPQGQWQSEQRLHAIDLSNPDAPAEASVVALPTGWASNLLADGRTVYLGHSEWLGGKQPIARYYMDRVDLTDPAHPVKLASVNVPGVLVAVAEHGARIFTVDYQWNAENPIDFFDTLTVAGGKAFLDQALPLDAEADTVRVVDSHAYFTTRTWWWQKPASASLTTLHTLDVSGAAQGQMHEVTQATLGGSYTLRDAKGGHLFLETGGVWFWGVAGGGAGGAPVGVGNAIACVADDAFGCGYPGGGDSVVVFGLGDPAHPSYQTAARVNGWILSIVLDPNDSGTAYLPSGFYGLQSLPLQ